MQKVLKYTRTEVQRNMFLTSPYLIILSSSPWTMPRSLFRWLLHVMAADQNQLVTSSIYAVLQRTISQVIFVYTMLCLSDIAVKSSKNNLTIDCEYFLFSSRKHLCLAWMIGIWPGYSR